MTLAALMVAPVSSHVIRDLLTLFVRIALAAPFWLSGRTKIAEGSLLIISDTTYFLFENEYSGVPLPSVLAAVLATAAEHVLPFLLAVGLGTRLAAFGLLAMTMTIQLFVYPDAWWNVHMQWAALSLVVIALGPGRWSLDWTLSSRRLQRS